MFQVTVGRRYNEDTEHEVDSKEFYDYRDYRDALEFFLEFGMSTDFELFWNWWENDNEIGYFMSASGGPGGNCGSVSLTKWPGFEKDVKVRYEEMDSKEFHTFSDMIRLYYGGERRGREVRLCLDDMDGIGLCGGLRNSDDDFRKLFIHVSEAKNPIQLLKAVDRVMQEVPDEQGEPNTDAVDGTVPLPF